MLGHNHSEQPSALRESTLIFTLAVIVGLLMLFAPVRFDGLWASGDTRTITVAARAVMDSGALVSPEAFTYPNGFAYQALVHFLSSLTRLDVSILQTTIASLLVVWMIVPAWLAFRALTGGKAGATLATIVLFVQPELLFAVQRGTHEKFTRGLVLLCVLLILKAVESRKHPVRFAGFLFAFYLAAFSLITFNNLFAGSFIIALAVALLGTRLAAWARWFSDRKVRYTIDKLIFALGILLLLTFIYTFFVYEPARDNILTLRTIGERIASLFLDMEPDVSNPYTSIKSGWLSIETYVVLSLVTWLTLFSSLAIWALMTLNLIRGQKRFADEAELLLWAFYGAFGFQGAISIIVDLSGALAGNLQHRILPSIALFAAPLLGKWFITLDDQAIGTRMLKRLAWIGFGIAAILAVLKATNEPFLSSMWQFATPSEMTALRWSEDSLSGTTLRGAFDQRLSAIGVTYNNGNSLAVRLTPYEDSIDSQDLLFSEVSRSRSAILKLPLPDTTNNQLTYDNGQAQVFHRRARTPFQK